MALIYIVEDDPSIQEIEMMALKNSNYMVQTFDRASSLYDKLEEIIHFRNDSLASYYMRLKRSSKGRTLNKFLAKPFIWVLKRQEKGE